MALLVALSQKAAQRASAAGTTNNYKLLLPTEQGGPSGVPFALPKLGPSPTPPSGAAPSSSQHVGHTSTSTSLVFENVTLYRQPSLRSQGLSKLCRLIRLLHFTDRSAWAPGRCTTTTLAVPLAADQGTHERASSVNVTEIAADATY